MPFGCKVDKTSAPPSAAGASCKLESAEDQALAAELLNYRQLPELHLATAPGSEAVWRQMVRERRWWRRTSLCERVGHCVKTSVSFLPMPGDVRVCVETPQVPAHGATDGYFVLKSFSRAATCSLLLEHGDYFENELAFVRRCLTRDAQCVDIGANHGVYCLHMAKTACEGGVWAFEPASHTADLLETSKNANELDSLHVCRAAVSDASGTARFVIDAGGSEYNHLLMDASTEEKETELVKLTTLDECVQQFSWTRMDFIKIDAEVPTPVFPCALRTLLFWHAHYLDTLFVAESLC